MNDLFAIVGFNFQMDKFFIGKELNECEPNVECLDLNDRTKSNWLFGSRKEAQLLIERYQKEKKKYVEDNQLWFTIMKV